jgi:hypothetical protein
VPSLQLIQKLSVRTLTKCQSLNSLLTVNKCYIQLLLFWFHFLDLLIKLMKMMLLYILYCPHPCHVSARICCSLGHPTCAGLPVLPPPPPPPPSQGRGRGDPSHGHVFGWRGEGRETGVKPPHAGWPTIQKILAFVTLIPHMQSGQGQNHH